MHIPEDLLYTPEHFWVRRENGTALCGITDYAQGELGDVVFVELPKVGAQVAKGERIGDVESIKTVSNLYAPLSGEIVEVNRELEAKPELLNQDPYGKGWICRIRYTKEEEWSTLLSASAYRERIK
ncbi:MAG: glycine cleavage system protein GcvH [Candidatus Caldatribacterium sp.]|nr:glycine cleavage system protein GcvH [Candidatus Caldatribacterium sp.]